jgi:hypothetical protein
MAPDVIDRFVRAARARDIAAMHALVDWPLSAAPVLARAMVNMGPMDRAAVARDGVAAIYASAAALQPAETRALTELAELIDRSDVARADAELTAAALAEWVHVPNVESGPAEEELATLAEWRGRAENVEEVYCADTPSGSVLLAVAPDGERVVVVTKL